MSLRASSPCASAKAEGVDPLGYYLGGWGYAYIQLLGDAIKGANSLKDLMQPNPVRNNVQLHRFEMDTPAGVAVADSQITGNLLTIFYTKCHCRCAAVAMAITWWRCDISI